MECPDTLREILSYLSFTDLLTLMTTNKEFHRGIIELDVYQEFREYCKQYDKLDWEQLLKNNYTKLFRYLYISGIEHENCFEFACCHGNLQLAQWLYSMGNVDIHYGDEFVFREVCARGYLEIAKWLFSLGAVDIHARQDLPFRWALHNNQSEMMGWLCSLE